MQTEDVTTKVSFDNNDDESLPLSQCLCGTKFPVWREIVSIYPENPWVCPQCGAKLFFRLGIQVFQVKEA